jgi:hypothetical protein
MEKSWKKIDEEAEISSSRQLEQAQKRSSADRDFYGAGLSAKRSAKNDDLHPTRDQDGELKYTIQQGLKAACYAREDVSATLQIQLPILQRLDQIKSLLWVCLGLLAYLAYKVS